MQTSNNKRFFLKRFLALTPNVCNLHFKKMTWMIMKFHYFKEAKERLNNQIL